MERPDGGDADFEIPVPLVLALLALPAGAFASMVLHRSGSAPSTAAVAGCYAAPEGPTLSLDGRRIHFGNAALRVVDYAFARERLAGLSVATSTAVVLARSGDGYRFLSTGAKPGSLFALVRISNGQARQVGVPADMEAIAVQADDGRKLLFERVSPERCRLPTEASRR